MRIQNPGWKKLGSGMEKSRIRIKKNIPDQQHCGEYADINKTQPFSANFQPKPTLFLILKQLCRHDRMAKTISRSKMN